MNSIHLKQYYSALAPPSNYKTVEFGTTLSSGVINSLCPWWLLNGICWIDNVKRNTNYFTLTYQKQKGGGNWFGLVIYLIFFNPNYPNNPKHPNHSNHFKHPNYPNHPNHPNPFGYFREVLYFIRQGNLMDRPSIGGAVSTAWIHFCLNLYLSLIRNWSIL